ncbi:MAG: NAD(P)-dependent oxidoreductase [Lachnospiraceae bacterium]|nr:NAD(P)-dependent oxidoreductase [Lachnospiraceae bacterium]
MKILVTGAGGMVGNYVAAYLTHVGHEVVGTVRRTSSAKEVRTVVCDLSKPITIHEEFELIIHTAGALPYRNSTVLQYKQDNIDAMEQLLSFAQAKGIPRMINLSTIGVYGEFREERIHEDSDHINPDPYGQSKEIAERMLRECGSVEGISLRMPGILGNGARGIWITNVIEKMKQNAPVTIYSPEFVTTNFVDVYQISVFISKLIDRKKWEYDTLVLACSKGNRIGEIVERTKEKLKSGSEILVGKGDRAPFWLDASRAVSMGYPESTPADVVSRFLEGDL